MIIVTGGAGFIGSNFVRHLIETTNEQIGIIDLFTYAASMENLEGLPKERWTLWKEDICNRSFLQKLFQEQKPRAIIHFAAESHVDRSISGPDPFITTNVNGTFALLEEARTLWNTLENEEKTRFRFLHVSTDEVYGSLSLTDTPFTEESQYRPNSPYSASKAGADHLVRAYFHTYGLPTIISNCSNNYGPRQHPEKLIPLTILNALQGKPLPLYGDGTNERNWLYVNDHCKALQLMLDKGIPGEVYLVGDDSSRNNKEIMDTICSHLDALRPEAVAVPHAQLIKPVADRPGHDLRYDINAEKLKRELGWLPSVTFAEGLEATIRWYLSNEQWIAQQTGKSDFKQWIGDNYQKRETHA
jgi:dTDP-glucose 4,6-dehydratase